MQRLGAADQEGAVDLDGRGDFVILMVFVAMMVFEGDYTFATRDEFFAIGT